MNTNNPAIAWEVKEDFKRTITLYKEDFTEYGWMYILVNQIGIEGSPSDYTRIDIAFDIKDVKLS